MGDLLSNLAARAVRSGSGLRPRVASRFEPREPAAGTRLVDAVLGLRVRPDSDNPEPPFGQIPHHDTTTETVAAGSATHPAPGAAPEPETAAGMTAAAERAAQAGGPPSPPRPPRGPVDDLGSRAVRGRMPVETRAVQRDGTTRRLSPRDPLEADHHTLVSTTTVDRGSASPARPDRAITPGQDPASPRRARRPADQSPPEPSPRRPDPGPAESERLTRARNTDRTRGRGAPTIPETVVQVTIGRIELRASPAPAGAAPAGAAPSERRRSPALSLDDYLSRRSGAAS